MCGRYMTPDQAAIEREWDLRGASSAQFVQKYLKTFNNPNATVKDYVPVIRDRGEGKAGRDAVELDPRAWEGRSAEECPWRIRSAMTSPATTVRS